MAKNLTFSVNTIELFPGTNSYLEVEINTDYPEEVLDSFTSEEIIKDYSDLADLYNALQEHFE